MELIQAKIIGYVFFLLLLLWLARLAHVKRGDLWEAIKGDDGKLQAIEIGMLIWFIFFPVLLMCEVFLQLHAGEKVWYSMDAIFTLLIIGNLGKEYFKNKSKEKEKTT